MVENRQSLTGCEWDVFISYANGDDGAVAPAPGWVSQLHDHLDAQLPAFIGGVLPRIFFDKKVLGASAQLPALEASAGNSAVFLAIASPAYAQREYTVKELNAFTRTEWKSRLFVVERMVPDPRLQYPAVLDSAIRRRFHDNAHQLGEPWFDPRSEAFEKEALRLAEEIGKRLVEIKATRRQDNTVGPPPLPAGRRCVLLAETCSEMEESAREMRLELQDIPVTVLPEAPYPDSADAFRSAFEKDLKRADMFVQLLGPSSGWMPKGMPEGHVRYQAQAAMGSGVEVLQWWPDHLAVDGLKDNEYKTLFTRDFRNPNGLESLRRGSEEQFRATVVRRLRAPKRPEPAADTGEPPSKRLFIQHDLNAQEHELALRIQKMVPYGVFDDWSLPMISWAMSDSGNVPISYDGKDAKKKMENCTKMILVHDNTTSDWVGGQIKNFIKLRGSKPVKLLEVIIIPPERGPRDDHGQRMRWLERIEVQVADLEEVIARYVRE